MLRILPPLFAESFQTAGQNDNPVSAFSIPKPGDASVTNDQSGEPIDLVTGSYLYDHTDLGVARTTDDQGRAVFTLPQQEYKVAADYLSRRYWSEAFVGTDETIRIEEGLADTRVSQGGMPLENVSVYVFNDQGGYLGISGRSAVDGIAGFRLTKGGLDIADAPVYLFTASGSYQGKMMRTDGTGTAVFMLPVRGYKFRIDHNGVQYWSDEITLLPDEETPITLNLDLLAMEVTHNPHPDRFDGNPPQPKTSGVLVASLTSLSGLPCSCIKKWKWKN